MTQPTASPQYGEAGRCSRCKENTVLTREECETCNGEGLNAKREVGGCFDCQGTGWSDWSTPCCGASLIDEGDACDEAYDRLRDAL